MARALGPGGKIMTMSFSSTAISLSYSQCFYDTDSRCINDAFQGALPVITFLQWKMQHCLPHVSLDVIVIPSSHSSQLFARNLPMYFLSLQGSLQQDVERRPHSSNALGTKGTRQVHEALAAFLDPW